MLPHFKQNKYWILGIFEEYVVQIALEKKRVKCCRTIVLHIIWPFSYHNPGRSLFPSSFSSNNIVICHHLFAMPPKFKRVFSIFVLMDYFPVSIRQLIAAC